MGLLCGAEAQVSSGLPAGAGGACVSVVGRAVSVVEQCPLQSGRAVAIKQPCPLLGPLSQLLPARGPAGPTVCTAWLKMSLSAVTLWMRSRSRCLSRKKRCSRRLRLWQDTTLVLYSSFSFRTTAGGDLAAQADLRSREQLTPSPGQLSAPPPRHSAPATHTAPSHPQTHRALLQGLCTWPSTISLAVCPPGWGLHQVTLERPPASLYPPCLPHELTASCPNPAGSPSHLHSPCFTVDDRQSLPARIWSMAVCRPEDRSSATFR